MYKIISVFFFFIACVSFAQNTSNVTILETRFRNPIDTLMISMEQNPSIVLFVHSNCKKYNCPTGKMLKELAQDSLGLRKENKIKLYVVYPNEYSAIDVAEFDSYSPFNATVTFDINRQYRKSFGSDINFTPFVIVFNGNGKRIFQKGGTYKDLYEKVIPFLELDVK